MLTLIERYLPHISESTGRWIRFIGLVLVLAVLCRLTYSLASVFTPIFIALAIAYVLNPAVTWVERRWRVSRLATVTVAFVLLGAVVIAGGLYATSRTIAQINELIQRLPTATQTIADWIARQQATPDDGPIAWLTPAASPQPVEAPSTPATAPASAVSVAAADNWWRYVGPVVEQHGVAAARTALNYTTGLLSSAAAMVTVLLLVPMYLFFFLWRFNDLVALIHDHLPAAQRPHIVHVVRTIDSSMSNFFRGRLIVCFIVGLASAVGWTVVGVPYSLLLGALAGTLNLVPFLSLLALPVAFVCAFLGAAEANIGWAMPLLWTMGVYLAVQALESFVLSPAIESRTSGLHPLTTVVALMVGAQLAGLLGMLLAIPVTSTLKTLAVEWLLPEIRHWSGGPPPDGAAPSSPVAPP